jgi:hypothetical protein
MRRQWLRVDGHRRQADQALRGDDWVDRRTEESALDAFQLVPVEDLNG